MNPNENPIREITVELDYKGKTVAGKLSWVPGAAGYVWHLYVKRYLWGQITWLPIRGFRFTSNSMPDDLFGDILEFYIISWYQ